MRLIKALLTTILLLLIATFGYCAWKADGVDDSIDCGTGFQSMSYNEAFTMYAEFEVISYGTKWGMICKQRSVTGNYLEFALTANADGGSGTNYIGVEMSKKNVGSDGIKKSGVVTNTIYRMFGIFDGNTTMQLYVDNVDEGTASYTRGALTDPDGNFYIGAAVPNSNEYGNVIVYEIAVWTTNLTATQVSLITNSETKGMAGQVERANLIGHWLLDDGEAGTSADLDTARDLSGNGNDGNPDDGANNTGCTWEGEISSSYPSPILMGQ